MINIIEKFADQLLPGTKLAIMPISRLFVETPFRIDGFQFMPAGSISLDELNIQPEWQLEDFWDDSSGYTQLEGESLRRVVSGVASGTSAVFNTNSSVAFEIGEATRFIDRHSIEDDLLFLSMLSQDAERALDWIRFKFCRFDLPATLPGLAGTWAGSGAFTCACIYDSARNSSELIAGEAVFHSVVSKGLGLELDQQQCIGIDGDKLPTSHDGEIGGIAKHGLRLFSDTMNANSNTSKFLRTMTLLEFLAAPFEFQKFQDSKKEIVAHIAGSQIRYEQLLERFRKFSAFKNESTGAEEGYRTLIVHHGHFLEEIIFDEHSRSELFFELQGYAGLVISDLIERRASSWSEVEEYRKKRRDSLLSLAKSSN